MQAGYLAVVVANETWTRQRKYDLQLEDSPVCLVCQGTEREEPDTIHHRKFSYQGLEKLRGTKSLGGLKRMFKGSTWEGVVKDGSCGSTQA